MNRTRRALLWTLAGAAPGAAFLAKWFSSRAQLEQGPLAGLDPNRQFDVCVAGSGPAGAILACELARRGIQTLIVEAGGVAGDGMEPALGPKGRVGFERRVDGVPPGFTYPIDASRFIGRGGTSRVWGGFCPRFRPVDFGAATSPDSWPIRDRDLEPYYIAAERELAVETVLDAAADSRAEAIANATSALKQSGFTFEFTPLSRWRGRPIHVDRSHLPEFESLPPATLATDARVTQIIAAEDGRIDSFEVSNRAGVKRRVRARVFVLAVGGIECPRLLLLSRSSQFPAGIGNQHDLVGRFFMEHLQTDAEGWRGGRTDEARPVETISWQFYDEFKSAGRGGMVLECQAPRADLETIGLSPIMEMEPSPDNRVQLDNTHTDRLGNPIAKVTLTMSARDIETVKQADEVMQRILSTVGMTTTAMGTFVGLLHHHMGTCRMASDPTQGVVDANLRVHGTGNLYVAGSASFPTSSASPPTLTIVALSLRLADHLERAIRATGSARIDIDHERGVAVDGSRRAVQPSRQAATLNETSGNTRSARSRAWEPTNQSPP